MISLFPPTATEWTGNGWITCQPSRCVVHEIAGGSYELEMEHPLTADQRWTQIGLGYIIKAPVPRRQTPAIGEISQEGKLIYTATTDTAVYSKPAKSTGVTLPSNKWNRATDYTVNQRVNYDDKPYICIKNVGPERVIVMGIVVYVDTSKVKLPSDDPEHWKLQALSNGSKALYKVKAGEEVTLLYRKNSNWFRARTEAKIDGYATDEDFTYTRTEEYNQGEMEARIISDQCFRIYSVGISSDRTMMTVKARHISYDYLGLGLDGAAKVSDEDMETCLSRIQECCTEWLLLSTIGGYTQPSLLTDITEGTITSDWQWKNPIFAVLDPSAGVVPLFKAKCVRDNLDIFILNNAAQLPSYRIAYGRNLIGVTWKRSNDEVVTHVVPRGKNANGTPRLLLPVPFIASDDAGYWPVPNVEMLDVPDAEVGKKVKDPETQQEHALTEQEVDDMLRDAGEKRFSVDHADRQKIELSVSFQHLGDTEEFKQYRGMEQLCLYDTVQIDHDLIGLAETAQVTEYEWDAILERYISIKLGDPFDYRVRMVAGFQLMPHSIDPSRLTPALWEQIKGAASADTDQDEGQGGLEIG